jgi:hypothetical protein
LRGEGVGDREWLREDWLIQDWLVDVYEIYFWQKSSEVKFSGGSDW